MCMELTHGLMQGHQDCRTRPPTDSAVLGSTRRQSQDASSTETFTYSTGLLQNHSTQTYTSLKLAAAKHPCYTANELLVRHVAILGLFSCKYALKAF